jgi:uncharacterized protein (DUF433 family)
MLLKWALSKKKGKLMLEVKIMQNSIVNKDPEILGGTPVFTGTRVPVRILFEHLEAGERLDDFLDSFPTVTRDQATQLLDLAMKQIIESDEAAA